MKTTNSYRLGRSQKRARIVGWWTGAYGALELTMDRKDTLDLRFIIMYINGCTVHVYGR
jgi:hypothetical protein